VYNTQNYWGFGLCPSSKNPGIPNRNQNHYTEDLLQQTGLFFWQVAYSRYAVPSKMF
jgi:hypothetical protein